MTRTKGLQTIQTLAESAETIRSRALADRRCNLQEEQRRLEQLERYRNEYQALSTSGDEGMCIHFVRGRRSFVDQLNDAVKNQRTVVEQATKQLETNMVEWRSARSKSLSLQKYADRISAEQLRREERQEQRELDDIGRRR